jgi:VWFA-related protein
MDSAKSLFVLLPALAIATAPLSLPAERPLKLGLEERAEVELISVNAFVVDGDGRTVPGLTLDDFEMKLDGKRIRPAALDVYCSLGALDEPRARTVVPSGPDPRRLILALDYQHLSPLQRLEVLERARDTLVRRMAPTDEIMIVALTSGLRVLSQFSSNRAELLAVLDRMQNDKGLYAGNFFHPDETGFVDAFTVLLELVGSVAGPKALILFSAMEDVPLETQFRRLASFAASAKVTIYPVDVRGLVGARRQHRGAGRFGLAGLRGAPAAVRIQTVAREYVRRPVGGCG